MKVASSKDAESLFRIDLRGSSFVNSSSLKKSTDKVLKIVESQSVLLGAFKATYT